jgi:hypothetical protein
MVEDCCSYNACSPGKISEKLSGACIAYGDDEKLVDTYNVLVYA